MSPATPSSRAAVPAPAPPAAATGPLAAVWLASAAVLSACLLAAFRLGFAADPPTLLRVNGPRVLFGAAVGALLALAGALRLVAGASRALRELELLALSAGAAGGGFAAAQLGRGGALAFAAGALAGAALAFALVRALDRPRRWTNLAAAALLVALAAAIAFSGTYARARHDFVAPAVAWLLGDLTGASLASGAALLALALGLLAAALHVLHSGAEGRLAPLSLLAFGLGVGAAGPLAFVGTFAPRCVRWLARGAAPRTWLPASLAAGAATVAAIDAVPRLLVGGYDFPFNLPATMLAVPIFLGWNRARLRARAGSAGRAFEWLELALIGGLTLAGVWFAHLLASVIAAAT